MTAPPADRGRAGRGLVVTQPSSGGRADTPFGRGLPLGSWKGVALRAHWSVLIIIALFAWLLADSLFPSLRPGESRVAYWVAGAVGAIVFMASLLAHELAHAVTARHYGMKVERITLWMLGGMAELGGEPPSPRAEALIAAAGPLTSLVIAGVAAGLAWPFSGTLAGVALLWLAEISLVLAVFNLLPGAPLDGGRLLRAALWARTHDRVKANQLAATAGRYLGWIVIALGLLELFGGGALGLWLVLVGWFIITGANSERYSVHAEKLRGLTVRDALVHRPAVAGEWWTVEQFLAQLTPPTAAQPVFPLVDLDGRLTGAIGLAGLERTPPELRATTRLHDVPGQPTVVVDADTDLPDLLLSLHLRGGAVVVVEDQRPVGVLSYDDLGRSVQLAELGWSNGHRPPQHS